MRTRRQPEREQRAKKDVNTFWTHLKLPLIKFSENRIRKVTTILKHERIIGFLSKKAYHVEINVKIVARSIGCSPQFDNFSGGIIVVRIDYTITSAVWAIKSWRKFRLAGMVKSCGLVSAA